VELVRLFTAIEENDFAGSWATFADIRFSLREFYITVLLFHGITRFCSRFATLLRY